MFLKKIVSEGRKNIDISSFLGFILAATKAQSKEIEDLRTEIKELKEIIEEKKL